MTNFAGFKTKEELMSHMESVLSCIGEYEGTNCVVKYSPIRYKRRRKDVFFVKHHGLTFGRMCFSLEEAMNKFLKFQGESNED